MLFPHVSILIFVLQNQIYLLKWIFLFPLSLFSVVFHIFHVLSPPDIFLYDIFVIIPYKKIHLIESYWTYIFCFVSRHDFKNNLFL